MNKRGYVLLGLLAVVILAGLLVREHFKAKDGSVVVPVAEAPAPLIAGFTVVRAAKPTEPVGGGTIVRIDDPIPVIRAQIAGSPSAVRLGEIAREFAAAEGLSLPQPDLHQPNIIATITVSAAASLTLDRAGSDGKARLWLSVQDKAMGEVPALRPVFDRLVAKLRAAFPDSAIKEVD